MTFLTIFLSPIFSFCGVILSLSMVMFTTLLKCAVLCSGYAEQLSDYLWQILICSCMSRFMAFIYSISDFYISNLFHLIDVCFLWCAHSFKGWSKEWFTSLVYMNITIPCLFFLFRCAWSLLFALNIICNWSLFIFIRARSCFVVAFQFLRLHCFVDVSNRLIDSSNFFVDAQFYKVGSNAPLNCNYISSMFY